MVINLLLYYVSFFAENRKHFYDNNNHPLTFQDFLQGRSNVDAYRFFMSTYIKRVIGIRKYQDRIMQNEITEDQFFTKTDETLALIAIENGEEQWEDKWNLRGCTLTFGNEHEWESTIATKWTCQGKQGKNNNNQDPKKSNGRNWSNDGLQRFNEIYSFVKHDRNNNPNFFQAWIEKEKDDILRSRNLKKKLKNQSVNSQTIDVADDFDSSEEEDNNNNINVARNNIGVAHNDEMTSGEDDDDDDDEDGNDEDNEIQEGDITEDEYGGKI